MKLDNIYRVVDVVLVLVPYEIFRMGPDFKHLVIERGGARFIDFWRTQVLLDVGS